MCDYRRFNVQSEGVFSSSRTMTFDEVWPVFSASKSSLENLAS
jgi:hypothetical protein